MQVSPLIITYGMYFVYCMLRLQRLVCDGGHVVMHSLLRTEYVYYVLRESSVI